MEIYVGYDSLSIIQYLEHLTGDFFTGHFTNCHFDEIIFQSLGEDKITNVLAERYELSWITSTMSHLDPCTLESETKVRRILDLQSMVDAFTDLAKVMRTHIPAANTHARIDVLNICRTTTVEGLTDPEGGVAAPPTWHGTLVVNQSLAHTLKCGGPPSLNDSQPRKKKTAQTTSINLTIAYSSIPTHAVILDYDDASENCEISVHYAVLDEVWNRNKMIVDDAFAYTVASDIMLSDGIEPCSVNECRCRMDWSNWKQAIQVELNSLAKRKVFGPVALTPPYVKPMGYK
ncbi:hypothetical protein ACFX19_018934 [Malus domestica]